MACEIASMIHGVTWASSTIPPIITALTEIVAPCRVRVERISDADPEMLQYFASRGIIVDAELDLIEGEPYSETTAVEVNGSGTQVLLGKAASDSVWASPVG